MGLRWSSCIVHEYLRALPAGVPPSMFISSFTLELALYLFRHRLRFEATPVFARAHMERMTERETQLLGLGRHSGLLRKCV